MSSLAHLITPDRVLRTSCTALCKSLFICVLAMWLAPQSGSAQTAGRKLEPTPEQTVADPLGERDSLFVDITRLGDRNWSVDISYFSDTKLFALSIPLKFTAGLEKVLIDSTIFTGGKAEHFKEKMTRADTSIQCLTIGLIAAYDPYAKTLDTGTGRLATVFLHTEGESPAPPLKVDTTTTAPSNSLMYVKNSLPPENVQVKIYPAFKVTSNEAAEKPKKKSSAK